MPNLSPVATLVAIALHELGGKLSAMCLAQTLEMPQPLLEAALKELVHRQLVSASGTPERTRYTAITPLALLPSLGKLFPGQEEERNLAACFRLREAGNFLESCSIIFERIDHFLDHASSSAAVACLGLGIGYLQEWNDEGHKAADKRRFVELVLGAADTSMYLTMFHHEARQLIIRARSVAMDMGDKRTAALCSLLGACLENMAAECSAVRLRLLREESTGALSELCDTDAITQLHYFHGMFAFWEGNFQKVLTTFEGAAGAPQVWKGRFQTEMFSLYTSSAAVYLGHFHRAVGILESARRTAELTQNTFKTMWWEAQLAMILLYMNRCEEALELIDHVISQANPESETKIYIWGMRGLAYYHFRKGQVKAAHQALVDAMLAGQRQGLNRPIYSYPWMFDMLLKFHEQGLPPVPGMILEDELARALEGPNRHLLATALRTRAVISLRKGEPAEHVCTMLQQSLQLFEEVGNPLEAARTKLHIAHCLAQQNLASKAQITREEALHTLAFFEQPEGDGFQPNIAHMAHAMLPAYGATNEAKVGQSWLLGTPAPEENPAENCRMALESIPPWQDVKQFLHQMTHIACCELGAERAALFRVREPGVLEAQSTCNITPAELSTGAITGSLLRILPQSGETPALLENEGFVSLVVPLHVAPGTLWFLYLESTYALRALRAVSALVRKEVADIFSQELRTALRHNRTENPNAVAQEQAKAIPYQDSPETLYHGSPVMRQVISKSRQVAATDAPALILGETGVGKELLARYIHDCSGRAGPFVPVHPASIPENLFESEFFGHEKGAFTGAHKQKIGLAEMAHGGTLFIDEVADIPGSTQVKLLRVFQEKRFLRVGGRMEVHSQFRLVGATNKNLWHEVQAGRFREDLYYRMSVVPLTLPPLRERQEDIPLLVKLFLDRFARRYHRSIPSPTPEDMALLMNYAWPGNVRELKSVVERAVILYRGGMLQYGLEPCMASESLACNKSHPCEEQILLADLPTLETLQRRYVQHVLKLTEGKITGERGALKILGMKRSTFYAKFMSLKPS